MRNSPSLGMNGGLTSLVRAVLVAFALALFAPAVAHADTFLQLKALIEHGQYDQARDLAAHASANPEVNKLNLAFTNALILYQGQDTQSAFGQVVGGFFGPAGTETAGVFDVQDHAGAIGSDLDPSTMKITGAFGATVAP